MRPRRNVCSHRRQATCLPVRDDQAILDVILIGLSGLLIILAVRIVADRTGLPAAVLFVVAGTLLSVFNVGPSRELDPDVVLELLIPPLLYAAALNASVLQMRSHLRVIASLSVGLVIATALAVGVVLDAIVPGLGIAAAIALGAAVAPPDPVAALAIGRRARMPERLTTLIEGEGLLNDATALTLYGIAVSAAVGGGFALPEGVGRFLWAVAGGVGAGLLIAAIVRFAGMRLSDPLLENALSLATPFAAFALAQSAEASGVLAVVVAGLWLGHQSPVIESGPARLQTRAVWRLLEFVLEGYVFLLIGQQADNVIEGLGEYPTSTVVAAALGTVGAVLLVRPLWLLLLRRLTRAADETRLSRREVVALWWAGTRGVITLATAFALPLDFPDRHLLLFCAYLVVLVTLVGQGLTFAPLLRALRLRADEAEQRRVRAEARLAAIEAALRRLDELIEEQQLPADVAQRLRRLYETRLARAQARVDTLTDDEVDDDQLARETEARGLLRRSMIDAEREELVRWRDAGRLPDASLRILQRELDFQEGSPGN